MPRNEALLLRLRSKTERIALRRAGFRAAGGLGLCNVLREHGHDADALAMGGHHHGERLGLVETKHPFQHLDDEIAGSVVVVEQYDFVQARTLDARLGLDLTFGGDLAHPMISLGRTVVQATRIFCHAQQAGYKPLCDTIVWRVESANFRADAAHEGLTLPPGSAGPPAAFSTQGRRAWPSQSWEDDMIVRNVVAAAALALVAGPAHAGPCTDRIYRADLAVENILDAA